MTETMSLISLRELTHRDSTISGTVSAEERINAVQSLIQTIQSRILFYQGKIWQGNELHSGNVTQGNRTAVEVRQETNDYAEELEHLWTVTAAVLMRTEMMKTAVFNSLSQTPDFTNILNDPGSPFPRLNRFLGVLEEQKTLCQELERERQDGLDKKSACVSLIARVGERIQNNVDSQMQEEQLKRMKKMYCRVRCARTIINHLIVRSHIDLVAHPEVLEIKIRSRTPPIIKF